MGTCRGGNGSQRRAQSEIAAFGRIDLGLREIVAKGPAPQEGEKGTLFILEGYDVDADRRSIAALHGSTGDLEAVNDAQRTVEPSSFGDVLALRADQQGPLCAWIAAIDVRDFIHLRLQPRFPHASQKP